MHNGSLRRRSRAPAAPKPEDIDLKTIRRRTSTPSNSRKSQHTKQQRVPNLRESYEQFYKRVASGQAVQPAPRRSLFGQSSQPAVSSSPALRAKLCPAFDTTRDWTRVQRKLLPKYLILLDAVTAVHLLKCLVRLQPLHNSHSDTHHSVQEQGGSQQTPQGVSAAHSAHGADAASPVLHHQQAQQPPRGAQQQQQPVRRDDPSLTQLAQLPTSIYGAIAGPFPGVWPAAAAPTPAQQAAAEAAAGALGFANAAAARQEFDAMLTAVYAVLAVKLAQWPFPVLAKVVACAGQLQLRHEAFLQAWCAASAPHLAGQPCPVLFSCLEALSRLTAPPPHAWWQQWLGATAGRLHELSLAQLAALQLHVLHLQQGQQPPSSWWQELQQAVLQKACDTSSQEQQGGAAAASRQGAAVAAGPGGSLADAPCTLLCTSHLLDTPAPQQWVSDMLQLCTAACQRGSVSVAGALQLLAACCCGCCRQAPGTAAAAGQETSLALLQQRMPRLQSPGGVAVLFACLQSEGLQQVPAGFADALALRLTEVLPGLPTQLLLQVPHALAAAGWRGGQQGAQGQRLAGALALASAARLPGLNLCDIEGLLSGCVAAGLRGIPPVWSDAVRQQVLGGGAALGGGAEGEATAAQARILALLEAVGRG